MENKNMYYKNHNRQFNNNPRNSFERKFTDGTPIDQQEVPKQNVLSVLEKMQNNSSSVTNAFEAESSTGFDNNIEFKADENNEASNGVNTIPDYNNDIQSMFDRINNNVKEATDIFTKNLEMRNRLQEDLDNIKREKEELEQSKVAFEKMKQESYQKFNEKRQVEISKIDAQRKEVEAELERLSEGQAKLENDINAFQEKKNHEYKLFNEEKNKALYDIEISKKQVEVQEENIREERNRIDEEKRQLKLTQVKLDSDKSDLASNLAKFNDLVKNFTVGINKFPGE